MNLTELGWNEFFQKHFDALQQNDLLPARVARAEREKYLLFSAAGELRADLTGKMRYNASSSGDLPVVGDWVAARLRPEGTAAVIEAILPRKSRFSRKAAGMKTDEQVLVANIDTVFLVQGLDGDYNLRRLERYLALAWDSGARPVIVLNKADLCEDTAVKSLEVETVAPGVPVCALSAQDNNGIECLRPYITPGSTIAFLGSSGVGKSTLINRLLGEERLKTFAVREDDSRGRHTTTHREVILLPAGGIVIDNPGMRELQLWADDQSLDTTFTDIHELAARCRFRDCTHNGEPGCAVQSALDDGSLAPERFRSYLKLKKELRYLATRKEVKAKNEKIQWEKGIAKQVKQIMKHRRKY